MAVKKSTKPRSKRTSQNNATAAVKTMANTSEASPASTPFKESKYAIGDLISHPMFGDGTVAAIDANTLSIEFKGNVVKQILDSYVKPRKP